jgi:hypothetical protein
MDYAGPSVLVSTEAMWEAVLILRNRGVKIRFITEITMENISYCEQNSWMEGVPKARMAFSEFLRIYGNIVKYLLS